MQEETEHADALIERMLFLGGQARPVEARQAACKLSVPEMLRNDLEVEYEVTEALEGDSRCANRNRITTPA